MVFLTFKTKNDKDNNLGFSEFKTQIESYYRSYFGEYISEILYRDRGIRNYLTPYIGIEFKEKVLKKLKDVWLDFLQNDLNLDPTKIIYDSDNENAIDCESYFNDKNIDIRTYRIDSALACAERNKNNYRPDIYDNEFLRIIKDISNEFTADNNEIAEINECGFIRFYISNLSVRFISSIFYGSDNRNVSRKALDYLEERLNVSRVKTTILLYKIMLIFLFPELFVEDLNSDDVKYLNNFDSLKLNPMFIFDSGIVDKFIFDKPDIKNMALVVNPDQSGRHYDLKTLRICTNKFKAFDEYRSEKVMNLIKNRINISIMNKISMYDGRLVEFEQIKKQFIPFLFKKFNEKYKRKFFPENSEFEVEKFCNYSYKITVTIVGEVEDNLYSFVRSVMEEFGIVSTTVSLDINYNWVNSDSKTADKTVKKLYDFLGFDKKNLPFYNFSFLRTNEFDWRMFYKFYPYRIL